jgi:UrcA family protein
MAVAQMYAHAASGKTHGDKTAPKPQLESRVMNTNLNTPFRALSLLAAIGLSAPGLAQSTSTAPAPTSIVRYHDLDLSSAAGIRTLYGRIQNAAWRVCLEISPTGIENVKCRQTLVDIAVGEVNRPALTALHTGNKSREVAANR